VETVNQYRTVIFIFLLHLQSNKFETCLQILKAVDNNNNYCLLERDIV